MSETGQQRFIRDKSRLENIELNEKECNKILHMRLKRFDVGRCKLEEYFGTKTMCFIGNSCSWRSSKGRNQNLMTNYFSIWPFVQHKQEIRLFKSRPRGTLVIKRIARIDRNEVKNYHQNSFANFLRDFF